MALVSIAELFDMVIMTLGVGFIFMDSFFPAHHQQYDPIKKYTQFDWHALLVAALGTAPAVIFHELAHKFVAISIGLQATFHAAYMWLGIGLLLKVLNTGFIFFVPGYVSTVGATQLQHAIIAFVGPFFNLVLFCTAWLVLQYKTRLKKGPTNAMI